MPYLSDPFLAGPLVSEHPRLHDRCPLQLVGKPQLTTQPNDSNRPRSGLLSISTEVRVHGSIVENNRLAKGVRDPHGQCQCFLTLRASLISITERPQRTGHTGFSMHAKVHAIDLPSLRMTIQGDCLVPVLPSLCKIS